MLKITIVANNVQSVNNALSLLTNIDIIKDYGIHDLSIDSDFVHAYSTYTDHADLQELLTDYINQDVFVTYTDIKSNYLKRG